MQEFAVGVALADRLLVDLQILEAWLEVFDADLIAEDDVEVEPLPAKSLLVQQGLAQDLEMRWSLQD
jgi:hypothetical protein